MEVIKDRNVIDKYIDEIQIRKYFTNQDIFNHMVLKCYSKGEYIISPEGVVKDMHFMVEGRGKVYSISNNGKILLLSFYKPFSVFGDVEYILGKETKYIAESLGNTKFLVVDMQTIREYTKNDIVFKDFLLKSIAKKLNQSASKNMFNLLYPLENRIASYIISISFEMKADEGYVEIFNLKDAACFLGSSYRHLIRVLDKLEADNVIKRDRKKIYILQREKLEILAEELYEWD